MTVVVCGLVFWAAYHDYVVVEHSDTGMQTIKELLVPLPVSCFVFVTVIFCAIYAYEERISKS